MSTFRVPLLRVDAVASHPAADRLSIVTVRGYETVVPRGPGGGHRWYPGDRVLYVPVGGELPEGMLREHGFWDARAGTGRLFGERRNRVSAIELRGRLSMGLVLPPPPGTDGLPDGTCLAAELGIVKYVPPVPPSLSGQVSVRMEAKLPYAIEHLLSYPRLLEGDDVAVTEKVHGVCSQVTYVPGLSDPLMFGGGAVTVTSKGLGDQGLVFTDVAGNAASPYVVTALRHRLPDALRAWGDAVAPGRVVTLVSEVYGMGIQDLGYGSSEPLLRAIDLRVGGSWLPEDGKAEAFARLGVERVPVLYRGRFDREVIDALHSGDSTLPGAAHIKEGVVVASTGPQDSRMTDLQTFVRPCLKYHSPAYDRREGGTEHG